MVNDEPKRRFEISRSANRFIESLPAKSRLRLKDALSCLVGGNIKHLDIKPLSPYPHEYRLRVGKIRILFKADKTILFIFKAGFRGDIYK